MEASVRYAQWLKVCISLLCGRHWFGDEMCGQELCLQWLKSATKETQHTKNVKENIGATVDYDNQVPQLACCTA